ncbi:unnamed protein product [Prunus armeniaca]
MSAMSSVAMVQSQSLHKVFVYGSLMAEDVCRVLLNRVPQSSPAILKGYHRYSIKGRVYPAILPVENDKVTGKLLLGITDPELHILDEFEDVEYERNTVEVSLVEWKQLHKKDFIKMTTGFMEELELPEAKPRVATYESFFRQGPENPAAS